MSPGMSRRFQRRSLALGAAAVLALVLLSSLVVVPESQQAVITRLGAPERVLNRFQPQGHASSLGAESGAGLAWRIPLVEHVVRIDKRLLTVATSPAQQVLSSDQQRLDIDATARVRVIDPVRLVRTAGNADLVIAQLQPILGSVLRTELGQIPFQSLLTPERGPGLARVRHRFDREARAYGVQVIDVAISRAALPEGIALDSALARMQEAREQEATTIRAQGQRDAHVMEADANAEVARISAASFGKDPQFFDFLRAMQSYETVFGVSPGRGRSTIVLSPDNDYLRQFRGGAKP